LSQSGIGTLSLRDHDGEAHGMRTSSPDPADILTGPSVSCRFIPLSPGGTSLKFQYGHKAEIRRDRGHAPRMPL